MYFIFLFPERFNLNKTLSTPIQSLSLPKRHPRGNSQACVSYPPGSGEEHFSGKNVKKCIIYRNISDK